MRAMIRMAPPQSGQTRPAPTASLSEESGDGAVFFPASILHRRAERGTGGAVTIRHEAKMANAMEAAGQGVKKKAADELVRLEPRKPRGPD